MNSSLPTNGGVHEDEKDLTPKEEVVEKDFLVEGNGQVGFDHRSMKLGSKLTAFRTFLGDLNAQIHNVLVKDHMLKETHSVLWTSMPKAFM